MKQKLLKNSLLLFLFGIIIVSCTLENEALHEHNHKNGLKIKTMSYADLMKNNQFSRAVKRIPKKQVLTQDFLGRSVVEDTYGFTIVDAPVKVVEIDNKTTYTLQVVSDENTTGELENLILFENPIDDKIGHIVTYNTAAITDKTANEIVEAGIKEEAIITTNGISNNNTDGKFIIVSYFYSLCNGIPYDCEGSVCGFGYHQETVWIPEIGGGGGDAGAGSGGDGGSGSEGSGGTGNATGSGDAPDDTPIVLVPTHCPGGCPDIEDSPIEPIEPCEKIKKQFIDNPTLHDKLNTLSGNVTATTERGFLKLTNSSIIQNAAVGVHGAVEFPIVPNGAQCTIFAHTHNSPASNTYSIFSWQDLEAFAKLIRNGKINTENFVAYLATADGTYYALTIEDPITFAKFFATTRDADHDPLIIEKMITQMDKYYDLDGKGEPPLIKENGTNLDNEKAFLNLLRENNLGASLFQTDNTFTTFSKIQYNQATDNIVPTPCN